MLGNINWFIISSDAVSFNSISLRLWRTCRTRMKLVVSRKLMVVDLEDQLVEEGGFPKELSVPLTA